VVAVACVRVSRHWGRIGVESGSRILITGGTGFVGSHLLDTLSGQDAQIRVLVRPTSDTTHLASLGVEWVNDGLHDVDALTRAVQGMDTVFHLAAATRARTEAEYHRVNAEGTKALVKAVLAARPRPRRLVYLSSLAVSGPARNGVPVGPHEVPQPLTAYGRSKLVGELACVAGAGELEVVALRAPAVYGPRDRDLYHYFRLAATFGVFPVPAGPDRSIQFLHVSDLVEALIRAATLPDVAGVYHIAESRAYTWSQIVQLMANAVGRPVRPVRVPAWVVHAGALVSEFGAAATGGATIFNREKVREILAPGWLCETETAKQNLDFEARIALPEGLTKTAQWYRENGWL
jgi:dihydroflavonol-4-reductase